MTKTEILAVACDAFCQRDRVSVHALIDMLEEEGMTMRADEVRKAATTVPARLTHKVRVRLPRSRKAFYYSVNVWLRSLVRSAAMQAHCRHDHKADLLSNRITAERLDDDDPAEVTMEVT